jgi:hypothetical protein
MDEEIKSEEVKDEEAFQEKKEAEIEKPLDRMTATELREVALGIEGIEGVHAMKKEDLLRAIKEARGIKDEEPSAKAKKKTLKQDVNVHELKQKIHRLKKEKEALRGDKDNKRGKVLRRRINRLKKRTRKTAAMV